MKNNNEENALMIIEILSCKGYFVYVLKDFPPLDNDIYQNLKVKSIPSEMYSSNGKKIITVRNLQLKVYYLILFGGSEENNFEIMAINKDIVGDNNEVDVLFYYYTTSEKNYNYLLTQDTIKYESRDDFYSINLILPETKKRDIFCRENFAKGMKYSFIITDEKNDFNNMESTCYLIKLEQKNNINEKYNNIDIILPTLNIIKIKFDLIISFL